MRETRRLIESSIYPIKIFWDLRLNVKISHILIKVEFIFKQLIILGCFMILFSLNLAY